MCCGAGDRCSGLRVNVTFPVVDYLGKVMDISFAQSCPGITVREVDHLEWQCRHAVRSHLAHSAETPLGICSFDSIDLSSGRLLYSKSTIMAASVDP